MTDIVCLHTRNEVEAFARRNPLLHLYVLGDLDDFFWPHTTWYALQEHGRVRQLVLVYTADASPAVLANTEAPVEMRLLLRALLPRLPRRFDAHLHPETADIFSDDYHVHPHGLHHKMGLVDRSRSAGVDVSEAVGLSAADAEEVQRLFAASYPGNWFVARMLETGLYYGIRRGGVLVSVAGVHVYSCTYKVAALGNITTHPDSRGHGLATIVTARLCQELLRAGIAQIGLNVKADNAAAIACYERLGFVKVADYGEYAFEAKTTLTRSVSEGM